MKKGFDQKIVMMVDLNKNNIQPDFYKIWSVRSKAVNFFVNFTYTQTDAKQNEMDSWSYYDFGFSWPKEHIQTAWYKSL
jgi:hypothetical protein